MPEGGWIKGGWWICLGGVVDWGDVMINDIEMCFIPLLRDHAFSAERRT